MWLSYYRNIILFCLIQPSLTQSDNEDDKNFSKCKTSHKGLEYVGRIYKSASGKYCQRWHAQKPIHQVQTGITDIYFPEQNTLSASNYCRNPSQSESGPWCYTIGTNESEGCNVPLCSSKQCRISGVGMDYSGKMHYSLSLSKCRLWLNDWKDIRIKLPSGRYKPASQFDKSKFPENSLVEVHHFCRNPDGDLGGTYIKFSSYFVFKSTWKISLLGFIGLFL